jgi:hypothetical protein
MCPMKFLVVTTRVQGLDPTDVRSRTTAFTRIYQQIPAVARLFAKYVPGCANAHVREIAPMLGSRICSAPSWSGDLPKCLSNSATPRM